MSDAPQDIPLPVVLYDGECGFCDRSVQHILDHDSEGRFHFSPLQSDYGKKVLVGAGLPEDFRDSIVLVDGEGTHVRSTAIARIAEQLDGKSRFLRHMRLIPRPLRDLGYRAVAAVRFKIFGRTNMAESCRLLPPEQRARFVL